MAKSTDIILETIGREIKANGNGGSLEGITAAIAANGAGGSLGSVANAITANGGGGTLQGIADAISNLNCGGTGGGNAVLHTTGEGFRAKKLTLTGAMQYNTPLYINDDAYAIFALRNNYASEPVMLSIEGQDIPLKIKLISNDDMPALYRDLSDSSGFSLLFGKDKEGKTIAYFLGAAIPPAFEAIAKLDLQEIETFTLGVKFDDRDHHLKYTKTLFLNNPNLLTSVNTYFTIDSEHVRQMVVCYDWRQPASTAMGFMQVDINEFTSKYTLIRADFIGSGIAFLTPLSAAAK